MGGWVNRFTVAVLVGLMLSSLLVVGCNKIEGGGNPGPPPGVPSGAVKPGRMGAPGTANAAAPANAAPAPGAKK